MELVSLLILGIAIFGLYTTFIAPKWQTIRIFVGFCELKGYRAFATLDEAFDWGCSRIERVALDICPSRKLYREIN